MVGPQSARPARRQCFIVAHRVDPPSTPLALDLPDPAAEALARLLPMLGCGEEAAAIAFDGHAAHRAGGDNATTAVLRTIAAEERVHDALLWHLRAGLPDLAPDTQIMIAARNLHLGLTVDGAAQHFARIAALDAAVCLVLGRLLQRGTPISRDGISAPVLRRIHRDEARHVRISREMARRAGLNPSMRDIAASARAALADVLALAGAEFDALAVDPALLDRAVRRLPDGLLA